MYLRRFSEIQYEHIKREMKIRYHFSHFSGKFYFLDFFFFPLKSWQTEGNEISITIFLKGTEVWLQANNIYILQNNGSLCFEIKTRAFGLDLS